MIGSFEIKRNGIPILASHEIWTQPTYSNKLAMDPRQRRGMMPQEVMHRQAKGKWRDPLLLHMHCRLSARGAMFLTLEIRVIDMEGATLGAA